jgi:hypothetical protein
MTILWWSRVVFWVKLNMIFSRTSKKHRWNQNFQNVQRNSHGSSGCVWNKQFKIIIKIQPVSQNKSKNHNPNLINDKNYMFDFPTRFHVLIENFKKMEMRILIESLWVENLFGIRDHDFNEENIFDEENLIEKFSLAFKLWKIKPQNFLCFRN